MSKRKNNIKIPKKQDIEEVVEEDRIRREKEEFEERIKVELPTQTNSKLCKNVFERMDAERAVEKRKLEYLKVMDKVIERQNKDNQEREER